MSETMGEYQIVERAFGNLIGGNMRLIKLWTGSAWAEGPVWFRDGDFLLFSDIPNNRIMRFVPDHTGLSGTVSVYRQPSNNTNGHTRDREGRLVSCEHGGRRVSRTELDGKVVTLVDSWNGKRLNSPNDVVVRSDGTVWFTDPPYGILTDLEGWQGEPGIRRQPRLLLQPGHGRAQGRGRRFRQAQRDRLLARREDPLHRRHRRQPRSPGPRHIRAFDVTDKGKLKNSRLFATCDSGMFDGFRLDTAGRVWSSAGDGVHCYAPPAPCSARSWCPRW